MFKTFLKPAIASALGLALGLGLMTAANAADDTAKPDTVLKSTVDQLTKDISANHAVYKSDKGKFYNMVDTVVVPRFDTAYITQIVLGPSYRTATPEQRSRFTDAFKNMLVRAYADAMLNNYDSVKVEWLPVRMAPGADSASVQTKLQRTDGNEYAISFQVHQIKADPEHKVEADWKIYDISVEGISLVTSFKQQVNAEIKKSSLDAVITKMEQGQLIKPNVDAKAS